MGEGAGAGVAFSAAADAGVAFSAAADAAAQVATLPKHCGQALI